MHGINEWVLILLVVLVIFGAGKLKNIGGDLGAAVKSFKEGLSNPKKKINQKLKKK
jgi:sec-independent protein translocase protein TatA|tara:strand:+ start:14127 stop:14294 length:168 start_codon:yes stop_codon:yes gene_type:complete